MSKQHQRKVLRSTIIKTIGVTFMSILLISSVLGILGFAPLAAMLFNHLIPWLARLSVFGICILSISALSEAI